MLELDRSTVFKGALNKRTLYLSDRKANFLGSRRLVGGYIIGRERNLLSIFLDAKGMDIYQGDLSQIKTALKNSYEDLFELSGALKRRKSLRNVDFIFGVTNKRLTRLLVNKVGFETEKKIKIPMKLWLNGYRYVVSTTPKELDRAVRFLRPKYRELFKR